MGRIAELREALGRELGLLPELREVMPYVEAKYSRTPAASVAALPPGQVEADTEAHAVTWPFQVEFTTDLKNARRAQEQMDALVEGFLARLRVNPTLSGACMRASVEPSGLFEFDEDAKYYRLALTVIVLTDEDNHV